MKLYICGDSFCVEDPEYGNSWVTLLQKSLPNIDVKNLSSAGASNYLIYLQVKQALEESPDFIIYHATSSIRQEFRLGNDESQYDSASRYWNLNNSNKQAPLICGSWLSIDRLYNELITPQQTKDINLFFKSFVDLPNLIEKNYIFILYILSLLSKSGVHWAWSPGGFEHGSFGNIKNWDFDLYRSQMCPMNLWDYYDPTKIRPRFHVSNPDIHQRVCNHYIDMLKLQTDSTQYHDPS